MKVMHSRGDNLKMCIIVRSHPTGCASGLIEQNSATESREQTASIAIVNRGVHLIWKIRYYNWEIKLKNLK